MFRNQAEGKVGPDQSGPGQMGPGNRRKLQLPNAGDPSGLIQHTPRKMHNIPKFV